VNEYRDVGVTSDSDALVTVQHETLSNVWITDERQDHSQGKARQITFGVHNYDGIDGLAWTADNSIVFSSFNSGKVEFWRIDPDGTHRRLLIQDSGLFRPTYAASCPNGRILLSAFDVKEVQSVWRVDGDGTHPKELLQNATEPSCSSDSNWVLFSHLTNSKWTIGRVSIEGGVPVQLTSYPSSSAVNSPDGKWIAFLDDREPSKTKIAIIPFTGGPLVRSFDFSPAYSSSGNPPQLQFTPDGRFVSYVDTASDTSNIFLQPLNGGMPKQITDFRSGLIFSFTWSNDGKHLALARGSEASDVFLIKKFR